jgi:IS5 family transposase
LNFVLNVKGPLIQLANTINWTVFDDAFEQHYSQDNGRPSKPIRLMVAAKQHAHQRGFLAV